MKKRILVGFGIFTFAVVFVFFLTLFIIDYKVKNVVKERISSIIGCKIEKIIVQPFKGRIVIKKLKIINPENFDHSEIITVNEIEIIVDINSLNKKDTEPIIIKEVIINDSLIFYDEKNGIKSFELISEQIEKIKPLEPLKGHKKSNRKVHIDYIVLNNHQINVRAKEPYKATVEKITFHLLKGNITMKNYKISNPEGYKETEMFVFNECYINIDIDSILKQGNEPIIINEIIFNNPIITYEVLNAKSNFQQIMERFPQFEKNDTFKDDKNFSRIIIIDLVEFRDGQVHVRAGYTFGQSIPLTLPLLDRKNIGRNSNGIKPAQAVGVILAYLASSVTELITSSAKEIADKATRLAANSNDVEKSVFEAGADMDKAVLDAGKDADAIKGLFK